MYIIFLEEGERRVCRGPFKAKILHSSSSLKKKKLKKQKTNAKRPGMKEGGKKTLDDLFTSKKDEG